MRVFFFFQAEDGIRDRNVTGVQTCALPISAPPLVGPERRHLPLPERPGPGQRLIQPQLQLPPEHPGMRPQQPLDSRSEERRVGKERRSRWWPEHGKKKENRARHLGATSTAT